MLDLAPYLLGAAEVALLGSFAALGAWAVRARLLPGFSGAPAHLATAVLALAILVWAAELLGTVGLFVQWIYLAGVGLTGVGLWALFRRPAPPPPAPPAGRQSHTVAVLAGLAIALLAVIEFAVASADSLRYGMTGFDTTWYHGTFAAGFFQSGNTWDLHFIAPQFLSWFYPANAELFHAAGMLAFDRDILSPLINLGWFGGCLLALWCIGRPQGVQLFTLALGVLALRLPAFADQAGEARNDIVGTFFLLAAVAILLNAPPARRAARGGGSGRSFTRIPTESANAMAVAGLAAGLAAGSKLNFVLPAAILVVGAALLAPPGDRRRGFAVASAAALAGGGYWYVRNLIHAGNPLPWFDGIGPIPLPAPVQPLGGREGHSVLGYLADGGVWADWLLPGLRDGLTVLWPVFVAVSLGVLIACVGRRSAPALRVAGAVGLAIAVAWLLAPTSASGPEGMPLGFESGLRYLVPALTLGLALLPTVRPLLARLRGCRLAATAVRGGDARAVRGGDDAAPSGDGPAGAGAPRPGVRRRPPWAVPRNRPAIAAAALGMLIAVAVGYPVQRHYLENRYSDPAFAAPGLNAAFGWARSIADARIATTATRQYPLFGTDLSNDVRFVGIERPHGGFTAPVTCREWRRHINAGGYDFVVASRDRVESGRAPYPPSAAWTEGTGAEVLLRKPPTVVFRLTGSLAPSACR